MKTVDLPYHKWFLTVPLLLANFWLGVERRLSWPVHFPKTHNASQDLLQGHIWFPNPDCLQLCIGLRSTRLRPGSASLIVYSCIVHNMRHPRLLLRSDIGSHSSDLWGLAKCTRACQSDFFDDTTQGSKVWHFQILHAGFKYSYSVGQAGNRGKTLTRFDLPVTRFSVNATHLGEDSFNMLYTYIFFNFHFLMLYSYNTAAVLGTSVSWWWVNITVLLLSLVCKHGTSKTHFWAHGVTTERRR